MLSPVASSPEPTRAVTAADLERVACWVEQAERILFVTGAGLSADSGLPTYRGVGGLYDGVVTEEGLEIEEVLSGPMMRARPELTWKYVHQVEAACRGAQPNRGHEVIAAWQARRGTGVVLTQNVDGLHRIGTQPDLIEIHGNLYDLCCTQCSWAGHVPDYAGLAPLPRCSGCGGLVRPRVVLFGEALPRREVRRLEQEMRRGFDLVMMVGTSALFPYIAAPVSWADAWGAHTVEINPGTSAVSFLVDARLQAGAAATLDALAARLGCG